MYHDAYSFHVDWVSNSDPPTELSSQPTQLLISCCYYVKNPISVCWRGLLKPCEALFWVLVSFFYCFHQLSRDEGVSFLLFQSEGHLHTVCASICWFCLCVLAGLPVCMLNRNSENEQAWTKHSNLHRLYEFSCRLLQKPSTPRLLGALIKNEH